MIYYIIIVLAILCFTAQFSFTKSYEKTVRPMLSTTLIMVAVTNLVGALLFLIVGGFQVEVSAVSLFRAAAFAAVMIPYFIINRLKHI